MAEIIPQEGATVFTYDWERLLKLFGAEAGRVDIDGEVQVLVPDNGGYAWKDIAEATRAQAPQGSPRFPPNDPRAQEGGKVIYVADPNSPPFMNNGDTKL